jgi:phosphoribosylformylglycinamidine synthase
VILQLPGGPAHSDFRISNLLRQVQAVEPRVRVLASRFLHLVDCEVAPATAEQSRLEALLTYGPRYAPGDAQGQWLLVAPRPGTTSPWSSKATDIARVCGIPGIRRIERGMAFRVLSGETLSSDALHRIGAVLHDRMTEVVLLDPSDCTRLFAQHPAGMLATVGRDAGALREANQSLGLALSEDEIEYLVRNFAQLGRDPTDVELMMFAQANSEHCRHKIFHADFVIDGQPQPRSLFAMIRNTHAVSPQGVLSA